MSIATTMTDQFRRAWEMCRTATEIIPEEHWHSGEVDYLIPARHLYHVLEAADFYTEPSPDGFVFGRRFGGDWADSSPDELPSREQMQEYLAEMEAKVAAWLAGLSDEQLVEPQNPFPWTGESALGRASYLLVHTRQHLGELNAELRRRGLERIPWR